MAMASLDLKISGNEIRVIWDEVASVWVAKSAQVPGLVTEALSFDALVIKLLTLVPELIELNEKQSAP